ncbi:MAG: hypothetical protein ACO1RX_19705 [Candidatus Sericytochromatia bacterium]
MYTRMISPGPSLETLLEQQGSIFEAFPTLRQFWAHPGQLLLESSSGYVILETRQAGLRLQGEAPVLPLLNALTQWLEAQYVDH